MVFTEEQNSILFLFSAWSKTGQPSVVFGNLNVHCVFTLFRHPKGKRQARTFIRSVIIFR